MNQLFDDLDGNDELVENALVQKAPAIVAFNKQEEIATKYAVTAPTITMSKPAENVFIKKRLIDEISKPTENKVQEDVVMVEEPQVDTPETAKVTEQLAAANVAD